MTVDDLRNLVKKFLSATDTEQYFSEESIEKLVQKILSYKSYLLEI